MSYKSMLIFQTLVLFDEVTFSYIVYFLVGYRYWLKVLSEHLPDLVDTVTVKVNT